jgi:hypothetical protein
MEPKRSNAFITAKKGVCYLTVKIGRRNFNIMRIYNYTIDAQDKRDMRRLHPDVDFDWKKLDRQLAEKREECRQYRSRRRGSNTARSPHGREAFYAVFDPVTRTVYADDMPSNAAGVGSLLDAILRIDRRLNDTPPPLPAPLDARSRATPKLEMVRNSGRTRNRKPPG